MTDLSVSSYKNYRFAGIKQLREIPRHWQVKRLKFVACINKTTLPEWMPRGYRIAYVDIGSVTYERGVEKVEDFLFSEAPSRARRLARPGDTVVSTVRTYLKAIDYIDDSKSSYVFSTGFAVLSPVHIQDKFLACTVGSGFFTNQVDERSFGISYPAISGSSLSGLYVAVPPEFEQAKIANYVSCKSRRLDEAVKVKNRQIELLIERKQILIQQAVTRGLNPHAPMRDSGIEWIGEIPAHWRVMANRALFRERVEAGRDGLPLLSVSIRSGVSEEEISEEENIRGRVKIEDKSKYIRVQPGDIAFNMMRAWQGAIGAVRVEGMVSPAYTIAVPRSSLDARYFEYQYRTPSFIQQMDRYSKGITDFRKRLYWDSFKQLITLVPPIEDQRAIIDFIEQAMLKHNAAVALLEQQITKLKEYKATLINSAVTGKIKVPGVVEPTEIEEREIA